MSIRDTGGFDAYGDHMSNLVLPGRSAPTNLRLRGSVTARLIDSDTYDIARRIQELDRSLFIVELHEDDKSEYAIMEACQDGVERLIFKVKQLDARVVMKLQHLMSLSLHARMDVCEKEEYKAEADRKAYESEKLYEELGLPMLSQLGHDGFVDLPISYPKRGVTGGKGSKAKS